MWRSELDPGMGRGTSTVGRQDPTTTEEGMGLDTADLGGRMPAKTYVFMACSPLAMVRQGPLSL